MLFGDWLRVLLYQTISHVCRQCSFADFKVSGLQKVYQDALHSLQLELLSQRRRAAAAHREQRKQPPQLTQEQQQQLTPLGAAAAAAATVSSSGLGLGLPVTLHEEALELQLVQLLLGLLYVEFEAGYTEQALAKMQVRPQLQVPRIRMLLSFFTPLCLMLLSCKVLSRV
jgi:hypothetical protein